MTWISAICFSSLSVSGPENGSSLTCLSASRPLFKSSPSLKSMSVPSSVRPFSSTKRMLLERARRFGQPKSWVTALIALALESIRAPSFRHSVLAFIISFVDSSVRSNTSANSRALSHPISSRSTPRLAKKDPVSRYTFVFLLLEYISAKCRYSHSGVILA